MITRTYGFRRSGDTYLHQPTERKADGKYSTFLSFPGFPDHPNPAGHSYALPAGYEPEIVDQGATSSCVGQAIAQAVRVMSRGELRPSALAIYAGGRSKEHRSFPALEDGGCQPALAFRFIQEFGFVDEEEYPFDPNVVNARLPLDLLQKGFSNRRATMSNAIPLKPEDVTYALWKGLPVVFAQPVDGDFEDYIGGESFIGQKELGTVLGWHYTCLVGVEHTRGIPCYRGINSWGTGWGDKGFYFISQERAEKVGAEFYALSAFGKLEER